LEAFLCPGSTENMKRLQYTRQVYNKEVPKNK
jgi:hypothetical protein